VAEYVRTGEAVGSETIAEHYSLGVSPATIRNEMSALEELGYLSHPHTSAGRIPTDLGYRRYVDSLPTGGRLREPQRRAIAEFFHRTVLDLEDVLRGTTQLLSRLTQHAGLAVPPSVTEERIVRVEAVPIGSGLLILVVNQHGRVSKRVLERADGERPDAAALWQLSNHLSSTFDGLTPGPARAKAAEMIPTASDHERLVLVGLIESLTEMESTGGVEVLVGGVANLAGEVATWRRDTLRRLMEALERESELSGLLREATEGRGLTVTIGEEHPATGLWDASVVAAPYRIGDTPLGTIGVVGPTRMDYVSVMAAVSAVARRVSELVGQIEGLEPPPERGTGDTHDAGTDDDEARPSA
jgi:heat-inducible transcriptional repressor